MTERLTLGKAIIIAIHAHAGQVDKNGVTQYIEHPLAVMDMVTTEDEKIVAVLHDVPEDTSVSIEDIRAAGATELQLQALDALKKRPDETYREYIARALTNPIGRVVKVADHHHNTDPGRLAKLAPAVAERLRAKYERVSAMIELAAGMSASD
jgi:(p)ppGpp synthase/HD superfamily hydrolase